MYLIQGIVHEPERMRWTRESPGVQLAVPNHIRPEGRLVTKYIELRRIQSKTPNIF
jgi:hypothetical protein